jgi:hypothetical protein
VIGIDLPCSYRFGQVGNGGEHDWFDYIPDTFRDLRLASGSVTLLAQVYLSAHSDVHRFLFCVYFFSLSCSEQTYALDLYFLTNNE